MKVDVLPVPIARSVSDTKSLITSGVPKKKVAAVQKSISDKAKSKANSFFQATNKKDIIKKEGASKQDSLNPINLIKQEKVVKLENHTIAIKAEPKPVIMSKESIEQTEKIISMFEGNDEEEPEIQGIIYMLI